MCDKRHGGRSDTLSTDIICLYIMAALCSIANGVKSESISFVSDRYYDVHFPSLPDNSRRL